jgi:CubicO group peptidase (beta-lactamase class C family)
MHDGGTAGYSTFVAFDEVRRVGVVVLSNTSTSVNDIGLHLLDDGIPLMKPSAAHREIAVSASSLQRFVGEYPFAPNFVITVTREDDKLMAQSTGQPKFQLFPEAETKFFLKIVDAQVEFETDATGNVTGMVLVQNGARQRAPKKT